MRWSHWTGIVAIALAGVVLTAGITYLASTLVRQPIGLASEPVTAGESLAPSSRSTTPNTKPAAKKAKAKSKARTLTTTTTTTTVVVPVTPATGNTTTPAGGGGSSGSTTTSDGGRSTSTETTPKSELDEHGTTPPAPGRHDHDD